MAKTKAERLSEIETCISNVLAGQDVSFDGNRITYPGLAPLFKEADKLRKLIAREGGSEFAKDNIGIKAR